MLPFPNLEVIPKSHSVTRGRLRDLTYRTLHISLKIASARRKYIVRVPKILHGFTERGSEETTVDAPGDGITRKIIRLEIEGSQKKT